MFWYNVQNTKINILWAYHDNLMWRENNSSMIYRRSIPKKKEVHIYPKSKTLLLSLKGIGMFLLKSTDCL